MGDDNRSMDVALEMTGVSVPTTPQPTVKTLAKSATSIRLIVQSLPSLIDGDMASLVAAMLMDEMERLPVRGKVVKVQMQSLRFTEEGAVAMRGYFVTHAATVRHVILNQMILRADRPDAPHKSSDSSKLVTVASAFNNSPLQVLDMSRNVIKGDILWQPWMTQGPRQHALKQLILDSVDMVDAESWMALMTTFNWEALEDLHVVLEATLPSADARDIANSIIQHCVKLGSMRWVQKKGPDMPLPLPGLRDQAKAASQANYKGIRHLILEGPGTPQYIKPMDLQDLCATVQELPRLKTLKLRHLGLTDISPLVSSFRQARPPLEVVDLSFNEITSAGSQRLTELSKVPRSMKDLQLLILSDNKVETSVALELFETFQKVIRLDNNPGIDFSRLVIDLIGKKNAAAKERDDLRREVQSRSSSAAASSGNVNLDSLQHENRRLKEERDALAKAFTVLGVSSQVEEQKRLMDRIQRLEDIVVLGAVIKGSNHGNRGSEGGADNARTGSRRRISVNDLKNRMAEGATAAKNNSLRSMNSNRSHSNRSSSSGGWTEDQAALATESPRPNSSSRGRLRGSGNDASSTSTTPPTSRSTVSPSGMSPAPLTPGNMSGNLLTTTGGSERNFKSIVRRSSLGPASTTSSPGSRRGTVDEEDIGEELMTDMAT